MKICFYSPYLPMHFGGGEKHFFDVASTVAKKNNVFIAIDNFNEQDFLKVKAKYEKFLNYSLDNLKFIASPMRNTNFLTKLIWTKQFDYLYYVTDGSLFFSLAKTNNLHIQIPFNAKKNSLIDRLKLINWQIKNTNSKFTEDVIEKNWRTKIDFVHFPKVSLKEIGVNIKDSNFKKERIILNVGRFFKQLHSKRQDILVSIFKKLREENPILLSGWKLVFIGKIEDKDYFEEIKEMSKGLPVEFYENLSRSELINYYQRSKIYWHATGFGVNDILNPEKLEHFGISTIEAMAAECIPIVYGKGGQIEIMGDELSNLLWQTKVECIELTKNIISNTSGNEKLIDKITKRAEKFDERYFEKILWEMF